MKILKYAILSFILSVFGFIFVALSAQLFGGSVTDTQKILYSVFFVSMVVIFCTMLIIDTINKR